jgi:hypothetical protein
MQDQLDYQGIRHRFSLAGEVSRWVPLHKVGTRYVGHCPFHRERQPSFTVYETRGRFYCYGCGAWGDIIDFVRRMQPGLTTGREVTAYLTEGNDRWLKINSRSDRSDALAEDHKATCSSKQGQIITTPMKEVCAQTRFFYNSSYALDARLYANERGWFRKSGELVGAKPYLIGAAYIRTKALRNYPLIGFPKFVLTRRTASLFGLEREFGRQASKLCVGVKVRLTPPALDKWFAYQRKQGFSIENVNCLPRWLSKPGFTVRIPWEFDSHEKAEVLVICEGPGDGLRLYNEAHGTELSHTRFGRHVHIIAVDSATAWTSESLHRSTLDGGKTISLFDGYRFIILLLDADEPGRKAATTVKAIIRQQAPATKVRDVVFSKAKDVCEFFDQGRSIDDLIEAIRASPPTGLA